jgi:DNA-binding CsgD family transcriptional regulator
MEFMSEVCAYLGDAERADSLYQRLIPYAGYCIVVGGGVAFRGSASRCLGMLASTMSRWDDAEAHFRMALEMNERMGALVWLAHTRHEYAKMLLCRGLPQDVETAGTLIEQAEATATELGMESLKLRLADLGRQVQAIPAAPRNGANSDKLTEREIEVLRLIALGKTNREIAESLYITLNTAAFHVKNILSKTASANRTEAAAYAMRHGIT